MTETQQLPADTPASPQPPPASNPTSRLLLAVGSVLGIVAVAWIAVFLIDLTMSRTTTTHESYDADRTVQLVADGDVTVRAADGRVEVDAVARQGITAPRYSVDERADSLVVTHRCAGWRWALTRCSGGLDVTLPAQTEVVVRTSNGEVVASGLAGAVTLSTSNGDVEVGDVEADVDIETSNGSVRVSGVDGTLTADSSNGRMEVADVTGSATMTTSNGRIDVAGVGGNVFAETSNGEVVVRGDDQPVRLTIETSNGRQTVEGPTDPAAERTVEIRSSNGDVSYLGR